MFLRAPAVSFAQGSHQTAPQVDVSLISNFAGYEQSYANAINDRGDIIGVGWRPGGSFGYDALLRTREGAVQLIAEKAVAVAINNRGDVVGYRQTECTVFDWGSSCRNAGFVWNALTGLTDLADFMPRAINNNGDIAGTCSNGDGFTACAIYNGVRKVWACELADCLQDGAGINERGDVVGVRTLWQIPVEYAMLFPRNGAAINLGSQTAEAINNSGVVAGRGPTALWPSNATLWTRSGVRQLLTEATSVAVAINSRGWAVGVQLGNGDGRDAAFFWDGKSPAPIYLAPDAYSSGASSINDHGEIVGNIVRWDGTREMVIWRVRP